MQRSGTKKLGDFKEDGVVNDSAEDVAARRSVLIFYIAPLSVGMA